jgi:hypothetical protein
VEKFEALAAAVYLKRLFKKYHLDHEVTKEAYSASNLALRLAALEFKAVLHQQRRVSFN